MSIGTQSRRDDSHWDALRQDFSRYLCGDGASAERAFGGLSKVLKGYFLARTRSDSDSQDLTQASLLKIHLSRASFDENLSLKTWVFVLAHRTLIDHWRKNSRLEFVQSTDEDIVTDADRSETSSDDPFVRMAQRKILGKALESLKPDDRTIVYLSVEEGMSMAEIAAVVSSSEGAVKVRMHRARKVLRQFIESSESTTESPLSVSEPVETRP